MEQPKKSIQELFTGKQPNSFSFQKKNAHEELKKLQTEKKEEQNLVNQKPKNLQIRFGKEASHIKKKDKRLRVNIRDYMRKRGMSKRMRLILDPKETDTHSEKIKESQKIKEDLQPKQEISTPKDIAATSENVSLAQNKNKIEHTKEKNKIVEEPKENLKITESKSSSRFQRKALSERPKPINLLEIAEEYRSNSNVHQEIAEKKLKKRIQKSLEGRINQNIFEEVLSVKKFFDSGVNIKQELRSTKDFETRILDSAIKKILKKKGVDRANKIIQTSIFIETSELERQDLWKNDIMQKMISCILVSIKEIAKILFDETFKKTQPVQHKKNFKNVENREILELRNDLIKILEGILARNEHLEKRHGLDTNRFEDNSFAQIINNNKFNRKRLHWRKDFEHIVKSKQSLALKEYKGRYKTLVRSLDEIVKLNIKAQSSLDKIREKKIMMNKKLTEIVMGPFLEHMRTNGSKEALDLINIGKQIAELDEQKKKQD